VSNCPFLILFANSIPLNVTSAFPNVLNRMYDHDAALLHQTSHVAITQLVSDIPSYGLNDQEMIEMAAFEECGLLTREFGHAEDYPWGTS
jgi:hypothetical protein